MKKDIQGFADHLVHPFALNPFAHPFALKQNQYVEFIVISGKWTELFLVGNINSLIAYQKCQLYNDLL